MKCFLALFCWLAVLALVAARPEHDDQCPATTPEQNEALVLEFYTRVFNDTNFEDLDRYVADEYVQHNPGVSGGKETFRIHLKPVLEAGRTKGTLRIAQSIAAGDFVWLHSKSTVFGKANAVVDIFRVECGRVAEHWDIITQVEPGSLNPRAYF